MLLKKRFLFFVVLALLICVGQAAAGSNANAVVSLDLIADGGAGNQRDDGVTSGTVSGQGTKIVVEVFAKDVETSLSLVLVAFDFDTSVLMLDKTHTSVFEYSGSEGPQTPVFFSDDPITLPPSGYVGYVEFSTVIDVTDKEFSLGIDGVLLINQQSLNIHPSSKIEFNREKQITAADADFDGSGVVDIADFLQFVDAYGSANAKYDLDNDGVVGISDFLAFVDMYGQTVQTVPVDGVEEDRAALIALYNATDGDNWKNNANWLSDKPLNEWYGVLTNEQGRVDQLPLAENQLSGPIPPEIGNLSNLEVLDLSDNQLSGAIPPEIGNLSNLWALFLHNNQLAGPIPPEIGNLSNLQQLHLASNQLAGPIPPEIGNLYLEVADLSGNPNLCMPATLSGWYFYDTEGVSKCSDTTGSVETDRAALMALYNATDGANWTDNTNWLSDKPLNEWFGVRTDAQGRVLWVNLRDNRLSGTIPPELENLSNLELLYLFINNLSGLIPPQLGNLSNLKDLSLAYNQLSGSIPPQLGNLSTLENLWLHENQLSGAIPPEIGNLSNLKDLSLEYNQLSGPIPPQLGNLSKLELLYLSDNQLSGAIPPEIGNLSNLSALTLGNNQLSGPIPKELGTLANLGQLFLGGNQLSGAIPSELGNLANLKHLWLTNNQLSGPIPSELGNLANLIHLWLGGNQLAGPIPPELGNLSNLERLLLRSNQLSGPIPSELGNLSKLEFLSLPNNQLSGPIPSELGNLTNLTYLELGNNQLAGDIPPELGNLSHLTEVDLSGNPNLCMPSALKDWNFYNTEGVAKCSE